MVFAVVYRTKGELQSREGVDQYLPDDYPHEVKEIEAESVEEVQKQFPNRLVMTAEDYIKLSDEFPAVFKLAEETHEKPWWKFW